MHRNFSAQRQKLVSCRILTAVTPSVPYASSNLLILNSKISLLVPVININCTKFHKSISLWSVDIHNCDPQIENYLNDVGRKYLSFRLPFTYINILHAHFMALTTVSLIFLVTFLTSYMAHGS